MTDIAKRYQNALDAIVGGGRLAVHVIHNGYHLCINSSERELLHTIQNLQQRDFGVEWEFRESTYGKSLTLPMSQGLAAQGLTAQHTQHSQHAPALFTGFADEYKARFQYRIQQIIDQYDAKTLDAEKQAFYELVKESYFALTREPTVDFAEYARVRREFERVRY